MKPTTRPSVPDAASPATQFTVFYGVLIRRRLASPAALLDLVIALFFLAVYTGAFAGADAIEQLTGTTFLTFILPVTILSASVAGSAAGKLLTRDAETGYLRRLLTLPVSRGALIGAAMSVGATQVTIQTLLILGVGLLFDIDTATGPLGLAVITGLALLWGLAFAGYTTAIGLRTRSSAAAESATFVFFPLLFVAPVFLPRDQLTGWLEAAATLNPITYVLEAMRGLLTTGWQTRPLTIAVLVLAIAALAALNWGVSTANRATART